MESRYAAATDLVTFAWHTTTSFTPAVSPFEGGEVDSGRTSSMEVRFV
jgi:hypothetical protein